MVDPTTPAPVTAAAGSTIRWCCGSPAQRAGRALERPDQVRRDPAAVEVALLRVDLLVVHPRRVDAAGIEREVVAQRLVARGRVGEAPGARADAALADDGVEVARRALELAPGGARAARAEEVAADVAGRQVER